MAQPSIVVCAFGFQFSSEPSAAFVQLTHARIAARALQILLIDHDHRLIEHIVQLVFIEYRSHNLSVPQHDYDVEESSKKSVIEPAGSPISSVVRCGHGHVAQRPYSQMSASDPSIKPYAGRVITEYAEKLVTRRRPLVDGLANQQVVLDEHRLSTFDQDPESPRLSLARARGAAHSNEGRLEASAWMSPTTCNVSIEATICDAHLDGHESRCTRSQRMCPD